MKVTLHMLYVKPETAKWYGVVFPEKNNEIQEAVESFPGVTYTRGAIDENTMEATLVFDSIEAYVDYKNFRDSIPLFSERKLYNEQNSIISFSSESYD